MMRFESDEPELKELPAFLLILWTLVTVFLIVKVFPMKHIELSTGLWVTFSVSCILYRDWKQIRVKSKLHELSGRKQ